MLTIKYGDLFSNIPADKNICIVHITNNANQMGSGFVVPLFTKWPQVKEQYHNDKFAQKLGRNKYIKVEENVVVVNMSAQDNLTHGLTKRCRYGYLAECMMRVKTYISLANSPITIYCPAFGSGIGGGDPDVIQELIEDIWQDNEVVQFILNDKPVSVQ